MTGAPLAERIGKLAERFDPQPSSDCCAASWQQWLERWESRNQMLAIATPGAQLGAAVDLLRHARPDRVATLLAYACFQAARNGTEPADELLNAVDFDDEAALLAAMEDL